MTKDEISRWLDEMAESLHTFRFYSPEKQDGAYKVVFNEILEKHGMELAEKAILSCVNDPERKDEEGNICANVVPSHHEFWEYVGTESHPDTGPLYDPSCGHCSAGWRELPWDEIDTGRRNKMITLYGFDKAHSETVLDRCKFCWRGEKTA